MPDVYATIAEKPPEVVRPIAHALETRAASPAQRAMLETYLSRIDFPDQARVLEIGCGTGPVAAVLAQWPKVGEVVGIDPSPILLTQARVLRGATRNLSFQEGDGRSLSFGDATFDAVVLHTTLSHVPGPEQILVEAFRVLRPGGWLAIFDGDYETMTVSKHPHDPLAACVESLKESFINDLWLMRRVRKLAVSSGFRVVRFDSHGYVETAEPGYMLTVVDRGADSLVTAGIIGEELAAALKAEARGRAARGEFFGHIAYASLIARKGAQL